MRMSRNFSVISGSGSQSQPVVKTNLLFAARWCDYSGYNMGGGYCGAAPGSSGLDLAGLFLVPWKVSDVSSSAGVLVYSAYNPGLWPKFAKFYLYWKNASDSAVYTSADPSVGLEGDSYGCSVSDDGMFAAFTMPSTSPYLALYKKNGSSFDRKSNPSGAHPESYGCELGTMDGTLLLAACSNSSPFLKLWSVNQSDGSTTDLGDRFQTAPASTRYNCAFSPNCDYFATVGAGTPNIRLYKNDVSIPHVFSSFLDVALSYLPSGTCKKCAFSKDGKYFAVTHDSSPYFTVYSRSGDVFTRIPTSSFDAFPTATAAGIAFSLDSDMLAVGWTTNGAYSIIQYGISPEGIFSNLSGSSIAAGGLSNDYVSGLSYAQI